MASFGKLLVPATLAAGTVFSVFTAPLAIYGSQKLEIQLREERIFEGELREIATPYLAFAGLLSLGTGIALCAVAGWRHSAQQFEEAEKLLTEAERKLKQKEAQLQETLLSETYLMDSGLRFFLDEDMPLNVVSSTTQTSAIAASPLQNSSTVVSSSLPQSPATPLPAAQAFLGFARADSSNGAASEAKTKAEVNAPMAKMQELQNQLHYILNEIEVIQSTLQVEAQPANNGASAQNLGQRLQALEPAWKLQKASS